MICIGMGSALPLGFRKGFRPEEQDRDELACPLIRPPAKNPQAHTLLPSFTTAYPSGTPPRDSDTFALREQRIARDDLPSGILSPPMPSLYAISYFCKRSAEYNLMAFSAQSSQAAFA
jgi:hypothetical protein